ncbi:11140_t:CDS:2 [Ambispora gerdemannii]|uniref:11140_t:CDS:1 n=1 Tax=Ambispora gerdemannii TaxID=144530 RepID=A0A9N8Z2W0_9GLOM|nr:11140_t:CDS:2 [Ambispora gerdemannii]
MYHTKSFKTRPKKIQQTKQQSEPVLTTESGEEFTSDSLSQVSNEIVTPLSQLLCLSPIPETIINSRETISSLSRRITIEENTSDQARTARHTVKVAVARHTSFRRTWYKQEYEQHARDRARRVQQLEEEEEQKTSKNTSESRAYCIGSTADNKGNEGEGLDPEMANHGNLIYITFEDGVKPGTSAFSAGKQPASTVGPFEPTTNTSSSSA